MCIRVCACVRCVHTCVCVCACVHACMCVLCVCVLHVQPDTTARLLVLLKVSCSCELSAVQGLASAWGVSFDSCISPHADTLGDFSLIGRCWNETYSYY